jgi:glutaminyl-tRNA synthetase
MTACSPSRRRARAAWTSSPTSIRTSKAVVTAQLEATLKDAAAEDRFQFERHGYFVADRRDSKPGNPVFNRAVTLKDSWTKGK